MSHQFPEVIFRIAEAMQAQGGRALLVGGIARHAARPSPQIYSP